MLADFKRAKKLNKAIASKVDPEIAKTEQAIRLANLETAIQEEPSNPQNYLDRGIERRKQKRYRDSVTDIQEAIALEQSNSAFHYQLGITQTWIDHKLAIPSYTRAIQLDEKNWRAYKERANSYRRLQEFDKAIADYTKIIEALQDEPKAQIYNERHLYPPLLTAYRQRGYLKRLNGESPMPDYEAAKKMDYYNTKDWIRDYEVRKETDSLEFDLPLEKEPNASGLLIARGVKAWEYLRRNLSRRHGKYFDEEMAVDVIRFAKWDLERAIEIDPENDLAYRTLGQILVYHPYDFMWEKGKNYLGRASSINPSLQNHWSFASASHQIAKTKEGTTAEFYLEEAEKAYESILEINPEHAGTKRRLADLRGQKFVAEKTVKKQVRDAEEVWKVETQMQINRWRKQHGMVPIGIK